MKYSIPFSVLIHAYQLICLLLKTIILVEHGSLEHLNILTFQLPVPEPFHTKCQNQKILILVTLGKKELIESCRHPSKYICRQGNRL